MNVQKFSHVIHLTSQVSGQLREGKTRYEFTISSQSKMPPASYLFITRFDAFRSIFPAGTVSGAPKIKAIELIAELEKERRGVYAGAVGRFDFANDEMDVYIAIRTMVFKDGVVYFQPGRVIIFVILPQHKYMKTIN